ncbi:hypothetical protein ACVILH_006708 [Bradyrhizobium sp. USDA 4353]
MPVHQNLGQHHRLLAQPVRLGLTIALLLSTLVLLERPAVAQASLRDQLEAWWNETQIGKSRARKSCVASEPGCKGRKATRTARGRDGAKVTLAAEARERAGKRRRHVAVDARAEGGGGVLDEDTGPRRDRPGRYFLHGPRF